jgi:hypothetical protein
LKRATAWNRINPTPLLRQAKTSPEFFDSFVQDPEEELAVGDSTDIHKIPMIFFSPHHSPDFGPPYRGWNLGIIKSSIPPHHEKKNVPE